MSVQELLGALMSAVIIPAVPVVVSYLIRFLQSRTNEVISRVNDRALKSALEEATNAAYTATAYTAQTYVNALKASGSFDKTANEQALKIALERASGMITADAKELLTKHYGDLETLLISKIEASIHSAKALKA